MTATAARKKLLIGTVVMWDNNPEDTGTVVAISLNAAWIDWKVTGQRGFVSFNGDPMKRISLWKPQSAS